MKIREPLRAQVDIRFLKSTVETEPLRPSRVINLALGGVIEEMVSNPSLGCRH